MARDCEIAGAITFFYYDDILPASAFYEKTLGLDLVEDQGWARIYRIQANAHIGIVDGCRGFHRPQPTSAVLLTLLVDDVDAWYAKLRAEGVPILKDITTHEDIHVRCFFAADPGGYAIEFQRFLDPVVAARFDRAKRPSH